LTPPRKNQWLTWK